ncbi:MAG: hypothetical protein HY892_22870 [Deltaproteobacteria bacterium]|nr:hypothetical protein [Deltaproteobacteria bacterium]
MSDDQRLSRRELLKMSLAMGGVLLSGPINPLFAQSAGMVPTSEQVMGPFYPVIKPIDQDADLTVIQGKPGKARGQVIYLVGRVKNLKGRPLPGTLVEIWQANSFGRYTHPNDRNPASLDPNFEGYGVSSTDGEGRFRFKTIKPAPYPVSEGWIRPPHIHFKVSTGSSLLVTQMYFAGEPLNEKDRIFKTAEDKESLITKLAPPTKDLEPGSLVAAWDIVLL